jgi:hypothetical protein
MDREKLFGGSVEEELRRTERKNTRAQDRQRLINKRNEPFNKLQTRNANVIRTVHEITKDGEIYTANGPAGAIDHRKVVVVLGDHPKTELTPDHVVVCGVTYTDRHGREHSPFASAEFAFAAVPRGSVGHFLADPHDLHDPTRTDVFRHEPEESLTTNSIRSWVSPSLKRPGIFGVIARYRIEGGIEWQVEQAENNLQLVTDAISNPALNPQLHDLESPVTED